MVIYVVNVTLKKEKKQEWLKWMKEVHIPGVLRTGYFLGAEIFSVILPAKSGDEISFSVQYRSETYEKFMSYTVKESGRLRKEVQDKFGNELVITRQVLESFEQ
jgi:antibiotic biosynthesis monooxygenase (ABM) superfamily enzyme